MDIKDYKKFDKAKKITRDDSLKVSIVMLFVIVIAFYSFSISDVSDPMMLVFATIVGGYMAMNIGANDVANNVGPAVGSRAITLFWAIVIAAVCEAMGAIIAGGDVVETIKSGIINQSLISDSHLFLLLMFSALLSAALWLNLATFFGAPVSTTHSLVGGILGAGIMVSGFGVVDWGVLQNIVLSWIISPVVGGLIAMLFLAFIKRSIIYQKDKRESAKKVVPLLMAIMGFSFSLYLALKGIQRIVPIPFGVSLLFSMAIGIGCFVFVRYRLARRIEMIENTKEAINDLFTLPLIFSAALLSFSHGANDVANAIGPLAAINQVLSSGLEQVGGKTPIPIWIMVVGALGIALGLALYGPRLIKTVGNEITDLDKKRAFCVAISAAITVLVASQLGFPVSSTHIAIGGIFGVGFLREYLQKKDFQAQELILQAYSGKDKKKVEDFLQKYNSASMKRKGMILKALKKNEIVLLEKKQVKKLKKAYKTQLVKRSAFKKIVASWLITVPFSAGLSVGIYLMLLWFGL